MTLEDVNIKQPDSTKLQQNFCLCICVHTSLVKGQIKIFSPF